MKNKLLGGLSRSFYLCRFRKYVSYGFPIISFCNLGVHYETSCILESLPMTTITVTATTNGWLKLQGSWLCNDFSSPPQIFALVVCLTMPPLDSWTSRHSALQLYPLISPFFKDLNPVLEELCVRNVRLFQYVMLQFYPLSLREVNQKHLESFKMWCWHTMEITRTDHVKNVVLHRAKGGPGSSVGQTVRDRIPVWTRFSARPDRPWGPPSLL